MKNNTTFMYIYIGILEWLHYEHILAYYKMPINMKHFVSFVTYIL